MRANIIWVNSGLVTTFEAHQALSRDISPVSIVDISGRLTKRPQWHLKATAAVCRRDIDFTFAQFAPSGSSPGAFQFKDPDVAAMHELQWPYLASISGVITATDISPQDESALREVLVWLRQALWGHVEKLEPFNYPEDQLSKAEGYRREFFHEQMFDVTRTRRTSSQATFAEVEPSEPIGPGCITFPDLRRCENELAWGRILSLPNKTSFASDRPRIEAVIKAENLLANSYSELKDAREHLAEGKLKAAIRSAAPAVETAIRRRAAASSVAFPGGRMSFTERIDTALQDAGYPVYSTVDPLGSTDLLHLYRARSSMHEGDCYYHDSQTGDRVKLATKSQVEQLVAAAEAFLAWIDGLE